MSDITINYKGNAIATMDASGTKTLLTDGKYCEDDIEIAYVKPDGGGSSVLSGTFTPASNVDTVIISALAGMTQTHFFLKPHGYVGNGWVSGLRTVGLIYICFATGDQNWYTATSNDSGNNYGYYKYGDAAQFDSNGDLDIPTNKGKFKFVRSTGTLTCKEPNNTYGGYFAANVQYDWWAW